MCLKMGLKLVVRNKKQAMAAAKFLRRAVRPSPASDRSLAA